MGTRTGLAALLASTGLASCCLTPIGHDGGTDAGPDAGTVCVIAGKTYPDGTRNTAEIQTWAPCSYCDSAKNPTGWSNVPDGTAWGNDLCIHGGLIQGCWVNATFYPLGRTECWECEGDILYSVWPVSGTCADGGGYCDAGRCIAF
jgi:hypothetical protein